MGKCFKFINALVINTDSIFFLLILTLSGCNGHSRTVSGSVVKYSESHPRPVLTRITCQPAVEINNIDTLVISFTEYPGRAYSWELATPDSTLNNLKLVKVYRHSLSNKADPEAKAEFYFQGMRTGEERLVFRYFRPWEKTKPAADSCVIKVNIK